MTDKILQRLWDIRANGDDITAIQMSTFTQHVVGEQATKAHVHDMPKGPTLRVNNKLRYLNGLKVVINDELLPWQFSLFSESCGESEIVSF